MAFTSFGTGLGALAKGLAWRYDANAELKRIEMLTNQTKEYWTVKERQAKEWAEATKRTKINNEADAREYDAFYMKSTAEISDWAKQHPGYQYDPILKGQFDAMTDKLRNNDVTLKAENLDKQMSMYFEHISKNGGFLDTPAGRELGEQLDYRIKNGSAAYMTKYEKTNDWSFNIPENLQEAAAVFMKEHRATSWGVVEPEETPGVHVSEMVTGPSLSDEAVDTFINMHGYAIARDLISDWKEKHPDMEPPVKNIVRDFLMSQGGEIERKPGGVIYDENENDLKRMQIAAMNARAQYANTSLDFYDVAMRIGGNVVVDNVAQGCLPTTKILNTDGKVVGAVYNGASSLYSPNAAAPFDAYNNLLSIGYKPMISPDAVATITRKGLNAVIQTNVNYVREFTPQEFNRIFIEGVQGGGDINDYLRMMKQTSGAVTAERKERKNKDGKVIGYKVELVVPSLYKDYDGVIHSAYNNTYTQKSTEAVLAKGWYGGASQNPAGLGAATPAGTNLTESDWTVINSISDQ